jgi:hypothetical protein
MDLEQKMAWEMVLIWLEIRAKELLQSEVAQMVA